MRRNKYISFHRLERGFAVDHRRADSRYRATRHNRRPFADIGNEIVVDFGWLGILYVDGNIALATAIDLATRRCHAYPVWHFFLDELAVQFIH